MWLGAAKALGVIAFITIMAAYAARGLAYPSPELLRALAEVGVALLLGYIVESVWMTSETAGEEQDDDWLGFVCGLGFAGLVGIAVALLVAAHREGGHGSLLDDLGLWWSVVSLAMLGALVTLHPFLADRFTRQDR